MKSKLGTIENDVTRTKSAMAQVGQKHEQTSKRLDEFADEFKNYVESSDKTMSSIETANVEILNKLYEMNSAAENSTNEDKTSYFTAEGHGAVSNDVNVPLPFIVNDKQGITYESGKFTITQSGLYYISLTIYCYSSTRTEMFLNDDVA